MISAKRVDTTAQATFPLTRHFDDKTLTIDLARDEETLEKVLRLRYSIFKEEMGCNPSEGDNGIDQDQYDAFCDHLVVIDNDINQVVGTYRLLRSDIAASQIGFYSENEFVLDCIYEKQLKFCEIGRACIKKDYRGKAIIALLWAGIGSYIRLHQLDSLGGCATVGRDKAVIQRIYQYAKDNDLLLPNDFTIHPQPANILEGFDPSITVDTKGVKRELPPLLRAYFAMGAKLAPIPAYDPDFDVVDFFAFFNVNRDLKRVTRFVGN